ncbi:MAG: ABC transporter substrate-binding protein [Thermodesulfobacteriota bacterium]|nr:ABC transporter substrate-binding protein [Thermodesulfobacteriota bacterium]
MSAKMKTLLNLFVVLLFVSLFTQTAIAAEYNVTVSVDYTGPYAVVMPSFQSPRNALVTWWNETKGKELGIKITNKMYDMRYDPSVVASSWPGILTGDKPIVHLGLGGPDVAALMKRLPKDKVPMIMSTATYGFVWLPNPWVFQPRPTYAHEAAGFFNWVHMNRITDRPIRIAAINSKVSPAYVDQINGIKSFAKATPWAEIVGVEWVPMKPVTLISEVRRLSRKKPDFIWVGTNTVHVIGTLKAQKELGIHIPVLMSSHCGIPVCIDASKDISLLEGHYDSAALDSALDMSLPGAKITKEYSKKLGAKHYWNVTAVQSAVQEILTLRTVERAAAMVGPDNITGEAMREAMFVKPYTQEDLLGLAPTLVYTNAAPFSEKNLKVKCTTVKNGKHIAITKGWITVPEVPKWVKQR